MKNTTAGPLRVAVLGNFSGRNAGDIAILAGILRDVTETFPNADIRFDVPTINPRFIRRAFRAYPVRPVSLLPTNLSLKILGLPIIRTVLGADLVLVTDALLFERQLYNPLFNYLHTLSWVLPMGARRGVPIVLYNMSLGPVSTRRGRRCLTRVLEVCQKIIVRDAQSADTARELYPGGPTPVVAADSALSTHPAERQDIDALARRFGVLQSGRPTLGFNVNSYVDVYVRGSGPGVGTKRFQTIVAAALDRAIRELDVDVLFVETQPMDLRMARGVIRRIQAKDRVTMVANPPLGHAELAGFLNRVEAFIGMRTHSLILASSVHTPLASIISYPKNRGFLTSIDCSDVMLEFGEFGEESLWNLISTTWERRPALRERLQGSVEREREKARGAAQELAPWLNASHP